MAFKQFDIPEFSEPIGFEVRGQRFQCQPSIPAGLLFKIRKAMDDPEVNEEDFLNSFLSKVMFKSDYEKFKVLLYNDDAEQGLPFNVFSEIIKYLLEEYTGDRPTGPSSSASSANLSTGDDSMGGASQGELTYSRSLPTDPSM